MTSEALLRINRFVELVATRDTKWVAIGSNGYREWSLLLGIDNPVREGASTASTEFPPPNEKLVWDTAFAEAQEALSILCADLCENKTSDTAGGLYEKVNETIEHASPPHEASLALKVDLTPDELDVLPTRLEGIVADSGADGIWVARHESAAYITGTAQEQALALELLRMPGYEDPHDPGFAIQTANGKEVTVEGSRRENEVNVQHRGCLLKQDSQPATGVSLHAIVMERNEANLASDKRLIIEMTDPPATSEHVDEGELVPDPKEEEPQYEPCEAEEVDEDEASCPACAGNLGSDWDDCKEEQKDVQEDAQEDVQKDVQEDVQGRESPQLSRQHRYPVESCLTWPDETLMPEFPNPFDAVGRPKTAIDPSMLPPPPPPPPSPPSPVLLPTLGVPLPPPLALAPCPAAATLSSTVPAKPKSKRGSTWWG